jgi:hypothetical protein
MLYSILLHHALCPGLVSSPRNVRSCGCLKMTFGTRPRGHLSASPPFVLLRDIHSKLLTQYDCKEVCAQSQSQVNVGSGVGPSAQSQVNIGTGPRPSSQDGVSQLQEPVPLSLPQLNLLVGESPGDKQNSALPGNNTFF